MKANSQKQRCLALSTKCFVVCKKHLSTEIVFELNLLR